MALRTRERSKRFIRKNVIMILVGCLCAGAGLLFAIEQTSQGNQGNNYSTELLTVSSSMTSGSGTSQQAAVSKNEQAYDAGYWKWQAELNEFGAAYKGDIIRHLIAALPNAQNILEFGCSGGYILDSMPVPNRYGVEINPSSRAFAKEKFPNIVEIFTRPEEIPKTLNFDVIFTTSVLEHVDCPLCELRKLHSKLAPGGIMIVGLRNDGVDPSQTFSKHKGDRNHHIYTWNSLLLTNMLDSAGYKPCSTIQQFNAWHSVKKQSTSMTNMPTASKVWRKERKTTFKICGPLLWQVREIV